MDFLCPVRCFSCGSPVCALYSDYIEHLKKGETRNQALNELGVTKICCRRMMLGQPVAWKDLGVKTTKEANSVDKVIDNLNN